MGLARRTGSRFEANIWPGFVDAMTALLLVLMFVLSIFMIIQSVLRETISGQDKELDSLSQQVSGLFDALGLAQQRESLLEDQVGALNTDLSAAEQEREAQAALLAELTDQRDTANAQIVEFEDQVAALLASNSTLNASLDQANASLIATKDELASASASLAQTEASLSDTQNSLAETESSLAEREADLAARQEDLTKTRATLAALEAANSREISQKEALQLALAQARDEIDEATENARLAAAQREALDALIADLQADLANNATDLANKDSALEETLRLLTLNQDELATTQDQLATTRTDLSTSQERAAGLSNDLSITQDALSQSEQALSETRDGLSRTKADLAQRDAELRAEQVRSVSIEEMRARLAELETELTQEEKERLVQAAAAKALRDRLKNSSTELTAMTLALEEKRREAEETLTLLAAARLTESTLRANQADRLSEEERQKALLATARTELVKERTVSAENRRKLTLLNQQTTQLRRQLASLQELLDAAQAKDVDRNVEVQNLGSQLNAALAQVAAEQKKLASEQQKLAEEQAKRAVEQARIADLERKERERLQEEALDLRRYRSEFFARVGEVLKDRDGVQIQGDRFVFSSEVLFAPGSAVLGGGGRQQISRVASVIREVADAIPESVNWVLRVDGHTDNVPLSGFGEFADNWELSQARALSVVKFIVSTQGITPDRLAANGFGEYQPVDRSDTEAARAKNRRIELKFTER